MIKKRLEEIDILRGISVFAIILIHSCSYFLHKRIAFILWDYSQFAVAVFIFCSAYIFFVAEPQINISNVLKYLKKRLWRLLPTYYLFAATYLFLSVLFDKKIMTVKVILQNLFLYGGIDFNWLILLFVYLAILMPIIYFLYKNIRVFFYVGLLLSLSSSILFLFSRPLNYRIIMWLPWSLILYFTLLFIKSKRKKLFLFLSIIIFLTIFIVLKLTIIKGTQFQNKYPPNLYHLSYSLFSLSVLYFLSKINPLRLNIIKTFFYFLSSNSYTIFFIHLIVIFLITVPVKLRLNWMNFFLLVFLSTVLIQLFLNFLKKLTHKID